MNKNFTLQSFKSAVSNASDYLKGKGLEVSHSTMLNVFSVFLGSKNWNTLQAELKEKNNKDVGDNDLYKLKSGIILIISENEQDYVDYINNVIIKKIFNLRGNDKIIRNLAEEKYYSLLKTSIRRKPDVISINNLSYNSKNDLFESVLLNQNHHQHGELIINTTKLNKYLISPFENINYPVLKNAMRRSPDIIICDNLLYASQIDLVPASLTGHLVIVGMKAKNETDALTKVWDAFSKEDHYRNGYINSQIVKDEVKKIIDLNK